MHVLCDLYKIIRTFVKQMNGLSILIPTFNDECVSLVKDLLGQSTSFFLDSSIYEADAFEIIVADDGSTAKQVMEANKGINYMPHCRIIFREKNAGRAAIRNFLASEAKFNNLLFIDSDMKVIRHDFISNYMDNAGKEEIIYGGYDVPEQEELKDNLRYKYERSCSKAHTSDKRQKNPYLDFHTSNFLIPDNIMKAHPLDEQFRHYGYEDVAYGEELRTTGIAIRHIDNPMGFCRFESNANFVSKTEEGLRTLYEFREQLKGYSRLLTLVDRLKHLHLLRPLSTFLMPFMPALRNNLVGNSPSLKCFSLYKLLYFISLSHRHFSI